MTEMTEWVDRRRIFEPKGQAARSDRCRSIPDGVDRRGVVCIDYASPEEYAFGRPCVIRDGDRYRMWYSYRGAQYRLGDAESADGVVWTRMDSRHVLPPSDEGWDSGDDDVSAHRHASEPAAHAV
jgi:hypothetical protein